MKVSAASAIALLLVLAAVGAGLAASRIARPAPATPRVSTPSPFVPTPRPVPTTEPAVFRQPLSSGCATSQAVWVVANGGGLLRYDGENWIQVDSTLRSLVFAACDESLVYAVGPAGAVLVADDRSRQIRAVDVSSQDLLGISPLPDGAIAVGAHGAVMRLSGGDWQVYARGLEEDLQAIVAFGPESAWVVGAGGVSYRLEPAGWRPVATGQNATLRAVTGPNVQAVVAVGDGGSIAVFTAGQWTHIDPPVDVALRAVAIVSGQLVAVGEHGVVVVFGNFGSGGSALPSGPRRADLPTTCDLTSVFAHGDDLWVVASDGAKGGIWRLHGGALAVAQHWGAC